MQDDGGQGKSVGDQSASRDATDQAPVGRRSGCQESREKSPVRSDDHARRILKAPLKKVDALSVECNEVAPEKA
ncbi:hypothetical protein GCM10010244_85910 [Streptomyces coeruleorubidus]|nr:hypothetical protein GCM10010244_85910 [Streptomyces bellus]